MKKFIVSILVLLLTFSAANAQNKVKKESTQLKKDGTPDKRYSVNKAGGKSKKVHLKKDGTPDKRFKENKKK